MAKIKIKQVKTMTPEQQKLLGKIVGELYRRVFAPATPWTYSFGPTELSPYEKQYGYFLQRAMGLGGPEKGYLQMGSMLSAPPIQEALQPPTLPPPTVSQPTIEDLMNMIEQTRKSLESTLSTHLRPLEEDYYNRLYNISV